MAHTVDDRSSRGAGALQPPAIEWPTVAVAACIYAGFALLTAFHHALPWPLIAIPGGYLVAWHGSLQHEVVHGHPTRWPALNEALVFPPLWLWLPFRLYRASHLTHHRDEHLTDPALDPESWYLAPARWAQMGPGQRRLRTLLNTAPGRLLLGPPWVVARFAADSLNASRQGRLEAAPWLAHGAGLALVLAWVLGVCGIPAQEYLLLYVYPGIAFTLLRSFAEHEARPEPGARTCAVEAHPLLALMFLNNNLHPAHHACPGTPWYRLPAAWRRQRQAFASQRPDALFRGYARVLRRFAAAPRLHSPWPLAPLPAGGEDREHPGDGAD